MSKEFKPYVSIDSKMKEFSFKVIFLGVIMAVVLGAANVYLGLKAGMTVAATFPAAVMAMAVLRLFKGTILEENLARTTGAVGEALAAGAIFTIPAFVMSGVWESYHYGTATILMLVGGILGVLFVIVLRKTLIEDQTLPYPESRACSEIVKAGQSGSTGAGLVFGSMGLAALIEFFKNDKGFTFIKDTFTGFLNLGKSKIAILDSNSKMVGEAFDKKGGALLQSPTASPAFLGVGYIIGFRLSAITFSGGVFGWLFLMPVVLFLMSGELEPLVGDANSWTDIAKYAYNSTVKPIAVGGMLVGAFYTLFSMRKNLIGGLSKGLKDIGKAGKSGEGVSRIDKDMPFGMVIIAILVVVVAMVIIFQGVINSALVNMAAENPEAAAEVASPWFGALGSAIVMAIAGFLFAAVSGYLVGIIGSSSNPMSGLTLTTLLIAALLMVVIGLKGDPGIAATLAVATVVCCVAGVSGDMMQDWKVGHILGGTPWRMQIGGMIGVVAAALVLVLPIMLLDKVPGDPNAHAIGGDDLPAPQAGLMTMMAKGIVGGEMAWPLVIAGMLFATALILIKSPSPMLISVGMYLPFTTTFSIFIGGIIRFFMDKKANRIGEARAAEKNLEGDEKNKFVTKILEKAENFGLLLASGLVAGEALMGILLALFVTMEVELNEVIGNLANDNPIVSEGPIGIILYFGVLAVLAYMMIKIPIKKLIENNKD
ncbi:MAG: oligopeptide transporter, OPT family [bacterium]|nr:oligopeptide transporter, OPT family [bacterium]